MITQELLVILIGEDGWCPFEIKENNLDFGFKILNIFEIESKAKKWIVQQNYGYELEHHAETIWFSLYFDNKRVYYDKLVDEEEFKMVFRACQWILDVKLLKG